MRRLLTVVGVLLLAGCSTADPSPASPTATASGLLDCGELAADTCREVADAATLMLGTSPLVVEALELSDEKDGLQMAERYLVTLELDAAGDELVEVVRFVGKDGWSVRRLAERPGD